MTHHARTPIQIGAQIRLYRRKAGLSQAELASTVGLRQATISQIENGNPATRLDTLLSLLAVLGLETRIGERTQSSSADIEQIF